MRGFTRGELEVMQVLWEHGEQKPVEIQRRFPREIKNPALRSYLTILHDKGHLDRRRVGKAYHYSARTQREPAFASSLRDLANIFSGGSTTALLCQLIKSERLSEDELLELKRVAEEGVEHRTPDAGTDDTSAISGGEK